MQKLKYFEGITMFLRMMRKKYVNLVKKSRKSRLSKKKLSHKDHLLFAKKFATSEKALKIYTEASLPYEDFLPNVDSLPHYAKACERYYPLLSKIQDDSYSCIIAVGLLEHLKNPEQFLLECYRILKPGGRLFISVSSVFAVHRGPDDYFHVTQFGMRQLLSSQSWSEIDIKGSCGPFKTVGMMLERILLQCETRYLIRPFVELLAYTIPFLDRLIIAQYCDRSFSESSLIDSMMPSNIQLIATK